MTRIPLQTIEDKVPGFRYIPVICGPTGGGKSAVANELCRMTGGELVSCDSMQIYKGLDIGTAKPSAEEQQEIKHHLIDIVEPDRSFSVNDFLQCCFEAIDDILSRGVLPVLCGGTGQYISALRDGIRYVDEPVPEELISRLYSEYERSEEDKDRIYKELCDADPEAAAKIHRNNIRRVVRALAVYKATGKTFTKWNEESKKTGPMFPFMLFEPDYEECRDILYSRINRRVDQMMEQGLTSEADRLYADHPDRSSTAFQAIGYKEFAPYIDGKEGYDLDKVSYDIKLNTRHYAKRQLTWFRYIDDIVKLRWDEDPGVNAGIIIRNIRTANIP